MGVLYNTTVFILTSKSSGRRTTYISAPVLNLVMILTYETELSPRERLVVQDDISSE